MHELGRYLQRKLDSHGWTVSELIRRTGLSRQTVYNLLNDPREHMDQTPQRKTVNGLADALGVSPIEILTVSAQALGVPIEALPPESILSTATDRQILTELASRLSRSEVQQHEPTTSNQNELRKLRAVAPTRDTSQGQKTDLNEADDETPPPYELLAAHPYFETEHEKFEREHGKRGEESQDTDGD
ncbi:helix-turn-helix domain-containing protein [Glutamicibacter ardleyensis]|uniref:helix-turn-helix domain-containing protein n=1 Tax=Glutamicibacter ardleyensis TaxID=225894 RepID=UPI003FD620D8